MMKKLSAITIKEFVEKLAAGGGVNPLPADCVEYGYASGWLEAQDVMMQKECLQRKTAARISHSFLRKEQKEADEIDGSPAYILQDLFDCRACAGHIIQMYVKGIMDGIILPGNRKVFGTDQMVSEEEAEELLIRLFNREKRIEMTGVTELPKTELTECPKEQALQILRDNPSALLIDVRVQRAYEEKHLAGAENIPYMNILKNPYAVSEKYDTIILLYCEEGYQSRMAAQCLSEAGYTNVLYFAWNPSKQ